MCRLEERRAGIVEAARNKKNNPFWGLTAAFCHLAQSQHSDTRQTFTGGPLMRAVLFFASSVLALSSIQSASAQDAAAEPAADSVEQVEVPAGSVELPAVSVTTTATKSPAKSKNVAETLPPASQEQQPAPTAERGDGPVEGYLATRTTSGTRTDTPIKDIPQTVVVVPREVLEDRGGTDVGDALDAVPAITRGNPFGGFSPYEMNFRGMKSSAASKNGMGSVSRHLDVAADAANVERVEVMMGPAGTLYGRSDPGGTFNVITKQAQHDNFTAATATAGTEILRTTLDTNAILSADGSLLGRLNIALQETDSFRDFVEGNRVFISPTLTWKPSSRTRIILDGEFARAEQTFDRGLIAIDNKVGGLPIDRFLGEPNDGDIEGTTINGMLRVEHDVSDDLTIRFATTAKYGDLYGWTAEPMRLLDDKRTLTRRHQLRDYAWRTSASQIEAVGRVALAGMQHNVLVGFEVQYYRSVEHMLRSPTGYPIDIYNPVYGQPKPPITGAYRKDDSHDNYAIYVSDQIDITTQLKAQIGARLDMYRQVMSQTFDNDQIKQDVDVVTPRAGLTYEIIPNVTLFGGYAESFRPSMDADTGFITGTNGKGFDPERGRAYEAGVKFDMFNGSLSVTAAVFDILKTNVVTPDPLRPGFSIAAGEVRSQGFDLNVAGNITPEWRVFGGYTYTDARVSDDPKIPIGSPMANVPLHSFKLQTVYEFNEGPLRGVGIGGGITALDHRAVDSVGSGLLLPGYVTVDALAYYRLTEETRLSLNVENVFDTEYYASALGPTRITVGQPLTAFLTLETKF